MLTCPAGQIVSKCLYTYGIDVQTPARRPSLWCAWRVLPVLPQDLHNALEREPLRDGLACSMANEQGWSESAETAGQAAAFMRPWQQKQAGRTAHEAALAMLCGSEAGSYAVLLVAIVV